VAAAAQIEASKAFCKNLLAKYGIPTAAFAVFDDAAIAKEYLASQPVPVVVKADGLALGKGVFICQTHAEAENAIDEIMVKKAFGASGLRVVIEEFMTGPEVSLLFFCDGTHVVPMPAAQDHKRVYDGDKGPNTGGMGAFAPTPMLTKMLYEEVLATIVMPTVNAMKAEGREFRGILYCGLMLTPNGPRVLEYNARFGDPETQAILPLMETPLTEAMFACMNGTLDHADIDRAQARGAQVFHAGTAARDGGFVTDGGRVLGVVQCAPTLGEAIKKAYEAVGEISFEGMHFRRDIGVK
jgi:phosphoribosylamine--glycine ligase